jgi:hypothetical protein
MVSSKPSAVDLRATRACRATGMRGDVAQGLLGDAVQAERNVLRDGLEAGVGGERDLDGLLAADLGAMRF